MKDSGCGAAQKETMLTGIHHWNCVDNHPAKLSGKPSENQSENKEGIIKCYIISIV